MNSQTQSFNDGEVKIYKTTLNNELTLLHTLRYQERHAGYKRRYEAANRDIKIDLVLRCQKVGLFEKDTDILVAIPTKDGKRYKIMGDETSYPEDAKPPVMDLALEKVGEYNDIGMASYANLNCEIDVYGRAQTDVNELGEIYFVYAKIKSVMAEITPDSGSVQNGEGKTISTVKKYKIVVKADSITNLTNDMYFIFEGQRYDIEYFDHNYKYRDSIEIMCSLVVE